MRYIYSILTVITIFLGFHLFIKYQFESNRKEAIKLFIQQDNRVYPGPKNNKNTNYLEKEDSLNLISR